MKSNKWQKVRLRLLVALCACAAFAITMFTTSAVASGDDVAAAVEKSRLYALSWCYKNPSIIKTTVLASEWPSYGLESILNTGGTVAILNENGIGEQFDQFMSCYKLLYTYFGDKIPPGDASSDTLARFLEGMGYSKDAPADNSKGACAAYSFKRTDSDETSTAILCAKNVDLRTGAILSDKLEVTYVNQSDGMAEAVAFKPGNNYVKLDCNVTYWLGGVLPTSCDGKYEYTPGETIFSDFARTLMNAIDNVAGEHGGVVSKKWYLADMSIDTNESQNATYTMSDPTTAIVSAIPYLTNNEYYYHSMMLTNREALSLLQLDLIQYYGYNLYHGSEEEACRTDAKDLPEVSGYYKLNFSNDKVCLIAPTSHIEDAIMTFDPTSQLVDGTYMNFQEIIDKINQLISRSNGDLSLDFKPLQPGETPPKEDGSKLGSCYNGSGVLGWIACPVIEFMGNTVTWLYTDFIEPSLQIKAESIMTTGGSVYEGWSTFRNFANIIFAILFIVIILSQVTGIGLSNYNIKKILPRFIVVVILVNLSYIICQLAVDLSNLLGVGLRDIFLRILPSGLTRAGAGSIAGSILTGLGLGAGIAGIAYVSLPAVVAGIAAAGLGSILLILVALVGCVMGIIFFFILLGVRQAGVVILVVLAPVAIVCYALPNTKPFFDRWKKIFIALLLVYPICGLLMGGGEYASTLLLAAGGENNTIFYGPIAMAVSVVPFFFIPSLLKSSMTAMGNLGTKIANFGTGLGRGLRGVATGTRYYQEKKYMAQRGMNLARDQGRADRLKRKTSADSFGNKVRSRLGRSLKTELSASEQMQLARSQAGIKKAMLEMASEKALAGADVTGEAGTNLYDNMVAGQIDKNVSEAAEAQISAWNNSGLSSRYSELGKILLESGEALVKNFNDQSARAKFVAAQKLLENDEPGRDALGNALNKLEVAVGDRAKSNKITRWAASTAMSRNGGKIKQSSPELAAQLMRYLGDNDTTLDVEKQFQIDGDRYVHLGDLTQRVPKLNASQMPDVDEVVLQDFIKAMETGTIKPESKEYAALITKARTALNDPRIAEKINEKVGGLLHQIANMRYTNAVSAGGGNLSAAAIGAMANATTEDLQRIASGFADNSIAADTRDQMIATMQQTMRQAVDGSINLDSSTANGIHNILSQEGKGIIDDLTPEQRQRYASLLESTYKVDHSKGTDGEAPKIILDKLTEEELRQYRQKNMPGPGGSR